MHKYQLIFIGNHAATGPAIKGLVRKGLADIGIDEEMLVELTAKEWASWDKDSPTVTIYFEDESHPDLKIVRALQRASVLIIPVVGNVINVGRTIPEDLNEINVFDFATKTPAALANLVLEAFGLLRSARRLFISYKRSDSTGLAQQLYEVLGKSGYEVFLDTYSVPVGENFQAELWHRMADTDVIVLIDSPDFRTSRWTVEELGQASAMSIGIFQLIWPGYKPPAFDDFAFSQRLRSKDFLSSQPGTTKRIRQPLLPGIVSTVESLRARNLAARQKLLIRNFIARANALDRTATLQPELFIEYDTGSVKIAIIPTVGVPDAYHFHKKELLINKIRKGTIKELIILYDRTNIRDDWQVYLTWLNLQLTIQSVSIHEIDKWIQHH